MNQTIDPTLSIDDALDAFAAKQPTPGGGAAAALCGALAAAMGEMTLNYSVGRKANSPEAEATIQQSLSRLLACRNTFLELMEKDQQAFAAYQASKALSEADPARIDAINQCIDAPMRIMQTSVDALDAGLASVDVANRWLLSDMACCAELCAAAIRCGRHNVRVNLASLDPATRELVSNQCEQLHQQGIAKVRALVQAIEERTNAG